MCEAHDITNKVNITIYKMDDASGNEQEKTGWIIQRFFLDKYKELENAAIQEFKLPPDGSAVAKLEKKK